MGNPELVGHKRPTPLSVPSSCRVSGRAPKARRINRIPILSEAGGPSNPSTPQKVAPKLTLDLGSQCEKGGESYTIPSLEELDAPAHGFWTDDQPGPDVLNE